VTQKTLDARSTALPSDQYVGRHYLRLVVVLGALSTIGPLSTDTYLPALPQLRSDLHASEPQAQLTMTGLMIGTAIGQLIIGPISDAVGRRKPLLLGLGLHLTASVLCAIVPSVQLLAAARILQGVAGAAVTVTVLATVRDLFSGVRAAQLLSRLVLVIGVSPILAPSLGSALIQVTSWRGIFGVLGVVAAALFGLAWFALPETHPTERRMPARLGASATAYRRLLSDPLFVAMMAVQALVFSALFGYVSGSPFVLQEMFGLTTRDFGLVFGVNGIGLILMAQLNPTLVRRFGPAKVLTAAALIASLSGLALLGVALGGGGLVPILITLWFTVAGIGLAMPNAPAIALNEHGDSAGTASALIGSFQVAAGGAAAPLVGKLGGGGAVPMAAVIFGAVLMALLLLLISRRLLHRVRYD
jgi:DHA1 family bicyclomycin/chloramphenicol resistance-like MFS transporter